MIEGQLTTNTESEVAFSRGDRNGEVTLSVFGTFGGGTVQIELKDSTGEFYDVPGESYTLAFSKILGPGKSDIRFTLSGATSPSLDYRWT